MKANRAALAQAIDSVVDDTSDVDWGLMTIELDDVRDRELLRHIRLLSQISEIHNAGAGVVDERLLRARAHAIVSRMPTGPSAIGSATPAAADASTVSDELVDARAVDRWGRLELVELVGRGTFGDVYRARDVQLQREVAVKLLHVAGSHRTLADRMLREARALARIHHPNVVVVHDAEQRDGRAGLCMEFIRGRNLAQILETDGPRGAAEAAVIGQDVCQALAAVHAAGLLHRDVKAQNVMREDGGRVVLMDFGAGLVVSDKAAHPGIIGTPLYLPPEVLERGEVSVRSDIYSVGVLLYHLVTNDYPVRGNSATEILEAHRSGQVKRLRDVAPKLPSWFVRVVEKATAPDPNDRFASAGEFEAALTQPIPAKIWPLAIVALLTLAAVLGVQQVWNPKSRPDHPFVALLPLYAGLGVSEPVAAAVTDEVYQGLAMLDTLRVISPMSTAKAARERSSISDIASALQASAVIQGVVSEVDGELEAKLRLIRAGSDAPEWARSMRFPLKGFGSLRRDGALSIANALRVGVSPRILAELARSSTVDSQAYDAYAVGRSLLERAGRTDFERAREEFERTIVLSPAFAPAYAALGRVHIDMADGSRVAMSSHMETARANAVKALELDPTLAEAHVVLGQVAFQFDWDWKSAEHSYRQAIAYGPSDDFAHQCYSHFLAAQGRVDQAMEELREAQRLNPLSNTNDLEMVPLLQYARRFEEAEVLTRAAEKRDPNVFQVATQFGRIFAATGRYDQAIGQFEKMRESSYSRNPYVDAEIASAHAGAGRIVEAQAILDRLSERAMTEEVSPELFALVYTRMRDFDSAFKYLNRAVTTRSRRILWMKVDPRWDPLRSDPRFAALTKRMGV